MQTSKQHKTICRERAHLHRERVKNLIIGVVSYKLILLACSRLLSTPTSFFMLKRCPALSFLFVDAVASTASGNGRFSKISFCCCTLDNVSAKLLWVCERNINYLLIGKLAQSSSLPLDCCYRCIRPHRVSMSCGAVFLGSQVAR
jgi:hypothetical protein